MVSREFEEFEGLANILGKVKKKKKEDAYKKLKFLLLKLIENVEDEFNIPKENLLEKFANIEDFFNKYNLSITKLYFNLKERKKQGENWILGDYSSFKKKLSQIYFEVRKEILKTETSVKNNEDTKQTENKTIKQDEKNKLTNKVSVKASKEVEQAESKTIKQEENKAMNEVLVKYNKTLKQIEGKTIKYVNNIAIPAIIIKGVNDTIELEEERILETISKICDKEEYKQKVIELYKKYRYVPLWEIDWEKEKEDLKVLPGPLRKAFLYYLIADDEGARRDRIKEGVEKVFSLSFDEMSALSRVIKAHKKFSFEERLRLITHSLRVFFSVGSITALKFLVIPWLEPVRRELNETKGKKKVICKNEKLNLIYDIYWED